MAELTTADFPAWFEQLWERSPFPWQVELLEQVHADRRWPDLVDLPTGTGKTSLIDIAVFLQALDAGAPTDERWMPRRIVNVVDRRVVVDQTAQRAERIGRGLADQAATGSMRDVADRLRSLAGGVPNDPVEDPPLLVATLRGAIAKDESWMRRPDVPAILASTIDQVGSRLLFRGYGISRGMRPIHAGLLGNDVLWLLDEVHLARAFADTLAQLGALRRPRVDAVPDRWQVVEMSATPTTPGAAKFPATPLEADSHPLIGRRLRARKPVERTEVKVPTDLAKADEQFATECAKRARALVNGRARTVGVIVNRVDTARLVHQKLKDAQVESHLLTGRMRPVDRDDFWDTHRSRIATGRSRVTDDAPFVLVSTQCIEAGADLDLDAVVTEAAPLDALVQRFGRVDRLGDVTHAGEPHTSVIMARSTAVKDNADPDRIYEGRLAAAWRWMDAHDIADFGIRQLPEVRDVERTDLFGQPDDRRAPVLLPTILDQLSQTSHAVSAEPEVGRWLHGDVDVAPDVQVVWRADIDDDLIRRASGAGDDQARQGLTARLAACPPASTEALTVPIGAARRWLDRQPAPVTDVDGIDLDDSVAVDTARRPWVVWRQGQALARSPEREARLAGDERLRPGDVVVVPTTHGGLTDGTWDPASDEEVTDIAAVALHREKRVEVVRVHPALVDVVDVAWPTADDLDGATPTERRRLITALMAGLSATESTPRQVIEAAKAAGRRRTALWPVSRSWGDPRQGASLVLWAPADPTEGTTVMTGAPVDTDATDEASAFTGARESLLDDHQAGVGRWASVMAEHLGAGPALIDDLRRAGALHDEGKRDARFQLLLHQGDELAAAAMSDTPLAKSSARQPSAARRAQIRRSSGYPRHARHELTSLALIDSDALDGAADPELVLHLVASHHGWCRPFAPPLIDRAPVKVRTASGGIVMSDHGLHAIDAAPPARFWALTERYGWYGLAWLEAVLRLGDHRRSETEMVEGQR